MSLLAESSAVGRLLCSDKLNAFPQLRANVVLLRECILGQPRVLGSPPADKNARLGFAAAAEKGTARSINTPFLPKLFRAACAAPIHPFVDLRAQAAESFAGAAYVMANDAVTGLTLHSRLLNIASEHHLSNLKVPPPSNEATRTLTLTLHYAAMAECLAKYTGQAAEELPSLEPAEYQSVCRVLLRMNDYIVGDTVNIARGVLGWPAK